MSLDTLTPTLEPFGVTPTVLQVPYGAVIVIRCHDETMTPSQLREVQEHAQSFFPDHKVLVLPDSSLDVLEPTPADTTSPNG